MAIKTIVNIVILFIVGNILVQRYKNFPISANIGIVFAAFFAKIHYK